MQYLKDHLSSPALPLTHAGPADQAGKQGSPRSQGSQGRPGTLPHLLQGQRVRGGAEGEREGGRPAAHGAESVPLLLAWGWRARTLNRPIPGLTTSAWPRMRTGPPPGGGGQCGEYRGVHPRQGL